MFPESPTSTKTWVLVEASTWNRDSHGLFDYESPDSKLVKFKANESFKLFRKEFFVFDVPASNPKYASQAGEIIFNIVADREIPDKYALQVPQRKTPALPNPNDVYLVVRTLKAPLSDEPMGYELNTGDIFKLGRIEFRVLSTRGTEPSDLKLCSGLRELKAVQPSTTQPGRENPVCRICLSDSDSDMLISPCHCKGSMEYVHSVCLTQWFNSKLTTTLLANSVSYAISQVLCECCKTEIEPIFLCDSKVHELFHIEKPEWPYMIVEQLSDRLGHQRVYHMMSFIDQERITLGRGHTCDVRINDISVSRVHAAIKFMDGKFVLFDNSSKFGTLVLMTKDVPLTETKYGYQVGKSVLMCAVRKQSKKGEPLFKSNFQIPEYMAADYIDEREMEKSPENLAKSNGENGSQPQQQP